MNNVDHLIKDALRGLGNQVTEHGPVYTKMYEYKALVGYLNRLYKVSGQRLNPTAHA